MIRFTSAEHVVMYTAYSSRLLFHSFISMMSIITNVTSVGGAIVPLSYVGAGGLEGEGLVSPAHFIPRVLRIGSAS